MAAARAELDGKPNSTTALEVAAARGAEDLVHALLAAHASVAPSAFETAAQRGHGGVVRLLVAEDR